MEITTPKHRVVLWVAANLSLVALVPAAVMYFSRELKAGAYPVDADSIGIPIMGTLMSVLGLLLPVNIACWLLLRRYPGKVALKISAKDLRVGPRVVAGLGLAFGALCAVTGVWSAVERAPEFAAVYLLWCYVTLAIRAAFVASNRAKSVLASASTA